MPLVIECPSCKSKLKVADNALGKSVRCSKCQTSFKVPAPAPPPRAKAPPPPKPLEAEIVEEDEFDEEEEIEEEIEPVRRRPVRAVRRTSRTREEDSSSRADRRRARDWVQVRIGLWLT